jgi:glycerophosphoryl diester phosphodiesterase
MSPNVIAHRGASRARPENTIEAFRLARELGADIVELDVRLTADGRLAVHHDAAVPPAGAISALRMAELPPHVPELAAALEACEGMSVNVEIKNVPGEPGFDPDAVIADRVAEVVEATIGADRVLVSSFHLATVDRARERGLATAWLVVEPPNGVVDLLLRHGHGALHPWDGAVNAELVARCHDAGLTVNVWTVDDPDRMRELAGYDVDGICTNVPDIARAVLSPSGPA